MVQLDKQAVRDFQDDAPGYAQPPTDWSGALLKADGDLGPRTEWALAMADLPRLRREVGRVAIGELGEAETSENDSPRIRVYKAPIGGKPGEAWCAYGVSYVLRQAHVPGSIYTGSHRTCLHQFPLTDTPLPWDLFGWTNADGTGHVGFVAGYAPEPGQYVTLEFNSANRVRLCRRPREGLTFSRLPTPAFVPTILGAPLVLRAKEGTR